MRLVEAQDEQRQVLEALPRTLCHHDTVGGNVFRTPSGTVLIDWESLEPGAVGTVLASLLFESARRGDVSARLVAGAFDSAVATHLDGLGGRVAEATVRLRLDAAIGLRWKLAADVAGTLEKGESARRGSAPHKSPGEAMDKRS